MSGKAWELTDCFDAKIWAQEFCNVCKGMDEGFMISWFANALMAGHDYARRNAPANTQQQVQADSVKRFPYGDGGTKEE